MSEPEDIYQRLGREQQATAHRFMFRFVVPLLCVVGPLFIWADGPDYKSVVITVGGYACLAAIVVDAWRTRRGLPSFLWTPEQQRALHEVRRQKRRQVPPSWRSRYYRWFMDLAQVEADVLAAAEDAGVQVTVRPRTYDGYAQLDLTVPEAGDRTARVVTNGVEAFFLTLDGRFDLREFDWEPEGQRAVLHTLVGVAAAHLRGSSERTSQARRHRSDQEFLEVTYKGEKFRALA